MNVLPFILFTAFFRKWVARLAREMDKAKKNIASICHGPWALIDAEIVKGRNMTAAWSIHPDLKNAGVIVEDKPLVVDGNLMTSVFGLKFAL
jgi:protease I